MKFGKNLIWLVILSAADIAAAPASSPSNLTPWKLLVEAGDLPAADSPRNSPQETPGYPTFPKEWWEMAWQSEQENAQIFQLLHQSRLLMERNGGHAGAPEVQPTPASIQAGTRPPSGAISGLPRANELSNTVPSTSLPS